MKIKKVIPSFITTLNLIAGSLATAIAFNEKIAEAIVLIIIAAVFDFLDGLFARLLNAVSEFGKQLDSLADLISFGMAPASLFYIISVQNEVFSGYLQYLPFLIVAFSALRLAKFNIDDSQTNEFVGLPTPASALFIVSYVWFLSFDASNMANVFNNQYIAGLVILFLCFSMISKVRLFSLKIKEFKVTKILWQLIFVTLSIILLIIFKVFGLALIIILYIALSIIRNLIRKNKEKNEEIFSRN